MDEAAMRNRADHPVVVGVDGCDASWPAVLVGAWEARERRTTLLLVHGFLGSAAYSPVGLIAYYPPEYDALGDAKAMLATCAQRVRDENPDLTVRTKLSLGGGAGTLIEESRDASLVVVAARGSGGFAGLSIGSVSTQVAAHAHSPVIVVRPPAGEDVAATASVPAPGPVVVGVDGSPRTAAALAFAFEAAAARDVPLIALYAWWMLPQDNLGPVYPGTYDEGAAQAEARRILAEAIAGWSSEYPDVKVEERPVHTMNPSFALIGASKGAGLVVVGCRGRGGFTGLLLGSVGRDLVGHAHAPVAVVHDHA
jgi:nucleotide-binding universal stress UspA family protein